MQLHPTRTTVDLALAGVVTVALGLVMRSPAVIAWGGSLLIGLVVARAVTRVGVSRVRAAGFEMLWREEPRFRRVARGDRLELAAEIRNRDDRAARYVELRAVASPGLEVSVEPSAGEVPGAGRMRVTVSVTAPRVGRHAVHGLSLEVQGSPGLFEVPLTFANPFGIEVLPRSFGAVLHSARGGRSRMTAQAGRPGPLAGDGSELRELREHQVGDAFKHIAWKASARRGVLLVREFEREERDVVWLLLDASVELWAGQLGSAPLDLAIDEVSAIATRHLAQGDRVGLAVLGSRVLAWLAPERGPSQALEIAGTLARATGTIDADRSDLDEAAVAARVLEHLRPLDPASAARLHPGELDRIASRAERILPRAPMEAAEPFAPTPRERALRRYLDAYGVGSPPRQEPERSRSDAQLAAALERLAGERPHPSVIYVWSPAPDPAARIHVERALRTHPRRRTDLRWVAMDALPSVPRQDGALDAVAFAVSERVRIAQLRGEQALRRLGVAIEHPGHRRFPRFAQAAGR